MALTNLSVDAKHSLAVKIEKAIDLTTPKNILNVIKEVQLSFGNNAVGEADQIFHDRVILAGGSPSEDTYDLTDGTMKNPWNEAINFDVIKAIILINQSRLAWSTHVTTEAKIYFGGANATFFGPLNTTTPSAEYPVLTLEVNTGIMLLNPTSGGWNVTDTSGDDLVVGNDEAAVECMYDLILIGEED